jgi:hypothetical protein
MTTHAKRKPLKRQSSNDVGSPFAVYIRETQSALSVLTTKHDFDGPDVDVRIPECEIVYKRPALWVRITFEYPGVPFCTLRIEREDAVMQWVSFDAVAAALGVSGWEMPKTKPSIDTAARVVIANKPALIGVIEALEGNDVADKLQGLLWRQLS